MAKARKGRSRSASAEWSDPEIILFAGEKRLAVGELQQHSLSEAMGNLFGKKKEDVEAEWKKVVSQIGTLIDTAMPVVKNFSLDEITFELGFSAEEHIVFVAKAGVKTTISAKFKRKSAT